MAYEARVVFLPVIVGMEVKNEQSVDTHRDSDFAVQFQKTRPCRFFPRCRRGASCPFGHGDQELRPCPNFTKTRMCAGWADGRCKLDSSECRFAHGPQELRGKEGVPPAAIADSCPAAASPISTHGRSITTASFASTGSHSATTASLLSTGSRSTTTASLASPSNRSIASSASSRTASRESTARTGDGVGMQPVLNHWLKGVKDAYGQPPDSMPSPEQWRAILLDAMPDQYED